MFVVITIESEQLLPDPQLYSNSSAKLPKSWIILPERDFTSFNFLHSAFLLHYDIPCKLDDMHSVISCMENRIPKCPLWGKMILERSTHVRKCTIGYKSNKHSIYQKCCKLAISSSKYTDSRFFGMSFSLSSPSLSKLDDVI